MLDTMLTLHNGGRCKKKLRRNNQPDRTGSSIYTICPDIHTYALPISGYSVDTYQGIVWMNEMGFDVKHKRDATRSISGPTPRLPQLTSCLFHF
jgi:hypothetical protein